MKDINNLKILQYELLFDDERTESITLERIYGRHCERWGIRRGGSTLEKTPDEHGYFHFIHEPLPSSRDDDYFQKTRWASAEEAFRFWKKHRSRIVATSAEYRAFYQKFMR